MGKEGRSPRELPPLHSQTHFQEPIIIFVDCCKRSSFAFTIILPSVKSSTPVAEKEVNLFAISLRTKVYNQRCCAKNKSPPNRHQKPQHEKMCKNKYSDATIGEEIYDRCKKANRDRFEARFISYLWRYCESVNTKQMFELSASFFPERNRCSFAISLP